MRPRAAAPCLLLQSPLLLLPHHSRPAGRLPPASSVSSLTRPAAGPLSMLLSPIGPLSLPTPTLRLHPTHPSSLGKLGFPREPFPEPHIVPGWPSPSVRCSPYSLDLSFVVIIVYFNEVMSS